MAQGCLKCLKVTMCAANFLCFMCGLVVLGFGIYLLLTFRMAALTPNLASFNSANILLVTGIIISCVSFLGLMGALKENRCLLLTFFLLLFFLMLLELTVACLLLVYEAQIANLVEDDLTKGLERVKGKPENSTDVMSEWDMLQGQLKCCGVKHWTDWGDNVPSSCCFNECTNSKPGNQTQGCLVSLKNLFEENFLTTGISVIALCIVEVLGMCFAMTLYCHISRSGLGYKL